MTMRRTGSTALALVLAAAPAAADITPQQAWDGLTAQMRSAGLEIEQTQTTEGDTLVLRDVVLRLSEAELEDGRFEARIGEVTLSPTDEGGVRVDWPEEVPFTFEVAEDGERLEVGLTMTTEDALQEITGDAQAYDTVWSAETLSFTLTDLAVDGEPMPEDAASGTVTIEAPRSESTTRAGAQLTEIAQTVSAGALRYDIAVDAPDEPMSFSLSGEMRGLSGEGESAMPEGAMDDPEEFAAALAAGLRIDSTLSHDSHAWAFSAADPRGETQGRFEAGAASTSFEMSQARIGFDSTVSDFSVETAGPDMPVPVSATLDELALGFSVPLQAGDAPQDASLLLALRDLQVADRIWALFDPRETLPREPVTVVADLAARVSPAISLSDPEQFEDLAEDPPGEIESLTLRDLMVRGAGLLVTGAGAFTFDNTDLDTFDGMPRPEGAVDLQVVGANGLIDSLISMGLLTEEDAMGARMMLSMFTVPGAEADSATSRIEINEQGHILANGQRIQ
jgi:hypothetical protein